MRKSKQKDCILRIVKGTTSHPTAEWIYAQARREIPNISLGTVYRNLKLMSELGEITAIDSAGEMGRFDGNTEDHYHFKCQKCARIFDIFMPDDGKLDKIITQQTGYSISSHHFEFFGLCRECQPVGIEKK